MESWQNDWVTFVNKVASDYSQGMTDQGVSEKYCNRIVEWAGEISRISFDKEPLASLVMTKVDVELSDGRHGVVNYLGIVIGEKNACEWQNIDSGMKVRFKTSICNSNGPFPGIQWADLGDMRGYISIATNETNLLAIL